MTTAQGLAALNMRLNDEGDDTQLSDGTPNPQFYWADSDKVVALNMAQYDLFVTLTDLGKTNELKNVQRTATSSPLPSDFYKPLNCTVNGQKALLVDDPTDQTHLNQTTETVLQVYGYTAITTPVSQPFEVLYWGLPTEFVLGSGTDHQEFTEQFYNAVLPLAEFYLTYKDNADPRIILKRKFGEDDVQFTEVQDYVSDAK